LNGVALGQVRRGTVGGSGGPGAVPDGNLEADASWAPLTTSHAPKATSQRAARGECHDRVAATLNLDALWRRVTPKSKGVRNEDHGQEKDREITIIDRSAPRVAIQITDRCRDKTKTRRRQSIGT
jgi:hypothetical protein